MIFLEIRKQLQPKLEEERKKEKIAYISYNKLVIKEPARNTFGKRKRETSVFPYPITVHSRSEEDKRNEVKKVN